MNKFSIFFFVCSVFLSSSIKADVYDNIGGRINVITEERDDGEVWAKFEYCQVDQECKALGPREFYSLQELRERRFSEEWERAYAVAGCAFTAPVLSIGISFPGLALTQFATALVIVTASALYLCDLFVSEQSRQVAILEDKVLEDQDIWIEEEGEVLSSYAEELSLVLSKIDAQDEERYQNGR